MRVLSRKSIGILRGVVDRDASNTLNAHRFVQSGASLRFFFQREFTTFDRIWPNRRNEIQRKHKFNAYVLISVFEISI